MGEEKIRVVIADDVQQTRTDIKRLLYFEEDLEVVGEAADGEEAIEVVKNKAPDVVLMDINMPVMDGISATEKITLNYPQVSVVIISIQEEQEYLKKAIVAGAKDYLVKPISSEEMSSTIRHVYNMGKKRRDINQLDSGDGNEESAATSGETDQQVISLFCGKGGAGKTTIASNLAATLASRKLKVALVDLDLQFGDVSVFFNLNDIPTIADLVKEDRGITIETVDKHLMHHTSRAHLLAAPLWPQEAEEIEPEQIEEILHVLKKNFDCIILDTPAGFTDVSLLALESSDLILTIVKREISTIKNLKTSMHIFEMLDFIDRTHVILNQADLDLGVEITDLEKSLDINIDHLIADDQKVVVDSINKGVPLVTQYPNADISRDLTGLGRKALRGFSERGEERKARKGMFSFL